MLVGDNDVGLDQAGGNPQRRRWTFLACRRLLGLRRSACRPDCPAHAGDEGKVDRVMPRYETTAKHSLFLANLITGRGLLLSIVVVLHNGTIENYLGLKEQLLPTNSDLS